MTAKVYSICISEKRGELKKEIAVANIIEGFGIEGTDTAVTGTDR